MENIKAGDLLADRRSGILYTAMSDAYLKEVWRIPVVKVINPLTGKESVEYLRYLRKV